MPSVTAIKLLYIGIVIRGHIHRYLKLRWYTHRESAQERTRLEQFFREQFEARVEAETAARMRKISGGGMGSDGGGGAGSIGPAELSAILERERSKYEAAYSQTISALRAEVGLNAFVQTVKVARLNGFAIITAIGICYSLLPLPFA